MIELIDEQKYSAASRFLCGAILLAMLASSGCKSAPQAAEGNRSAPESSASSEAALSKAGASEAEQEPEPSAQALDTLLRLAGGGERGQMTDHFVYIAGTMLVMEADVEEDMVAFYRAQKAASFAPPIWGWAVSHPDEPRVQAVIESAEARGLPARAVYKEFLQTGVPGMMDPASLPEPKRPIAPELEVPSRADKLRATAALADGPEYMKDMATTLIRHLLGASDSVVLSEDETITVDMLNKLQQEFEAAGLGEQKSLKAHLEFVERELICGEWNIWREYPNAAPKPEHDRGCSAGQK